MTHRSHTVVARALQAAALALDYPDAAWTQQLPLLREVAAALPPAPSEHLRALLDAADRYAPEDLAHHYVETFDLRRRCCPYLTYYAFGDTRKRGMAMLQFTSAYRAAGFELASGELPDHFAVVCEFTARRPDAGAALLTKHRAGLELLHLALTDAESPYRHVTGLVRSVLPEPAPADLDAALELARSGPPAEEVGLEPFAPPEYMGARR